MKYECPCGYIYDPETGDPDSGIAPGTAWEDIRLRSRQGCLHPRLIAQARQNPRSGGDFVLTPLFCV